MATLRNTTFNSTSNILLPSGLVGTRPGAPASGMIRFNTNMNILEFFNGTSWQLVTGFSRGTLGTGGDTILYKNGYIIHIFSTVASSTFTPAFTGNIEVMVVAGGGGGGTHHGGGGAGGGVIINRAFPVSAGTPYPVTVGSGSTAATFPARGNSGGNSVFSSLTAIGGGAGGSWNADNSLPGGSGIRFNQQTDNLHAAGGGGGAGAQGMCGSDHAYDGRMGDGGAGMASDIYGDTYYWGGGGGGSNHHGQFGKASVGGVGGGGAAIVWHGVPRRPPTTYYAQGGGRALNKGQDSSGSTGGNGGTNTGGGGGGSNYGTSLGGPGIVVIRY